MNRRNARCFAVLSLCGLAAASFSESLTPSTIPLMNSQAYVFPARVSEAAAPSIVVLDGHEVRVFDLPATTPVRSVTLPQGTSAVDFYDVNTDGTTDVIAVAGPSVLIGTFGENGRGIVWETVLERASLFSNSGGAPFPRVLATVFEDATVIALPQTSDFEMWDLKGELRTTLPYDQSTISGDLASSTLQPESADPASFGAGVTMAHRISSSSHARTAEGQGSSSVTAFGTPEALEFDLLDVSDLPSEQWPSFPLNTIAPAAARVLYAPIPPRFDDTYIRFQPISGAGPHSENAGPRRRYPGRLLNDAMHHPDFNRDGYVDLVTWKSPQPGGSLGALLELLRDGTWPVHVSVHPYDPGRGLYSSAPLGTLKTRVPREWMAASPVRNLAFRDFDGDGMIDVGFCTAPARYSIWMYTLEFPAEPSFEIHAPGVIDSVVADTHIGSEGTRILLLRGPRALYVTEIPRP